MTFQVSEIRRVVGAARRYRMPEILYHEPMALTDEEYLRRILTARVYDVAEETPLDRAEGLSERFKNDIRLKREDLQPVFSFKVRGAYNRMHRMSRELRARGVIAASAGNHAQGVALAAKHFGCRARIVMPLTTPSIKTNAVRRLGAEVELFGDSYAEAEDRAREEAAAEEMTLIHPYNDPDVIAGQGTVAMELLRQAHVPVRAIFVPVGGGGLISGIALYAKQLYPEISVVGVEHSESTAMEQSLREGKLVRQDAVGGFADGVAVKSPGEETFRICRRLISEIIIVDTDETCAAIRDVFEDTRSILEPSGALSVAGLKKYAARSGIQGACLVAVTSGANMNFSRLRFVAERTDTGDQREVLLAITIPERPGSFRKFISVLDGRNVTEFNYRYSSPEEARLYVGVTIADRDEKDRLISRLLSHGFPTVDMMDNDVAKSHVRYMVGGRAPHVKDERIIRFEFPEKPGALTRFLESMAPRWNISLFHYRNHGTDVGRVLAGIQVPAEDAAEFDAFLALLNYRFHDETRNPAVKLFL